MSRTNTETEAQRRQREYYGGYSVDPISSQNTEATDAGDGKTSIIGGAKSLGWEGGFGSGLKQAAKTDAGAFGQIAQGLAGIAGGIIGGGKRRREQRAATKELAARKQAYENFEFEDHSRNLTNTYEDLTVNQQQSQFLAQQQQQGLANTMSGLSAAAGGSGIAAMAQAMAQTQAQNLQAASASIGMQEQRNQALRAQGQQALEMGRMQGGMAQEKNEFGRTSTLLGMAQQRKSAADEARRKATEGLVGGVANLGVGAARVAFAGGA